MNAMRLAFFDPAHSVQATVMSASFRHGCRTRESNGHLYVRLHTSAVSSHIAARWAVQILATLSLSLLMIVSNVSVATSPLVPGGKLRIATACVLRRYASNLLCFHVLRAYKKYIRNRTMQSVRRVALFSSNKLSTKRRHEPRLFHQSFLPLASLQRQVLIKFLYLVFFTFKQQPNKSG